jgi:hypothetical protein
MQAPHLDRRKRQRLITIARNQRQTELNVDLQCHVSEAAPVGETIPKHAGVKAQSRTTGTWIKKSRYTPIVWVCG